MLSTFLTFVFLLILPVTSRAFVPSVLNTKKVSFIFVGPSRGLSESSFGHVALRLSPKETPGIVDMVVEFVADIPSDEPGIKKYIRGVGIGKNYPVSATFTPFHDFKKRKTIIEDRTLDVYELDLSEEELKRGLEYINDFQNKITSEEYSFFKKNCSFFSALAIEKALERRLGKKSLPWKVPGVLQKEGILGKKSTYPAASLERGRYARKYLDEGLSSLFPHESWVETFENMIQEMNFTYRRSSYLKLLWVMKYKASGTEKKKIQALLRYLLSQEEDSHAWVLRKMFEESEKKEIIITPVLKFPEGVPGIKRLKHRLIFKDDSAWISLKWTNHEGEREAFNLPLNSIKHSPENQFITFHNDKVGRLVKLKKEELLLTQRLDYALDLNKEKKTLRAFILVDQSEEIKNFKKDLEGHKNFAFPALNNVADFQGEAGSCYALTLLQKAFIERAIFVPEVKARESMDKLQVMKVLLSGNYAVIPGYSNVREFTTDLDKEVFKNFIRQNQVSLTKGSFAQMTENITQRQMLNKKTLVSLKSLVEEGLVIPLIIGMAHKGTKKVASPYAHMVLVLDVKKMKEGGHRLTIYDPNTNINTLLTLDEDYKLQYPFYDKAYDYLGMVDKMQDFELLLDHAVRSREFDYNRLKLEVRSGDALFLTPVEVTKILK